MGAVGVTIHREMPPSPPHEGAICQPDPLGVAKDGWGDVGNLPLGRRRVRVGHGVHPGGSPPPTRFRRRGKNGYRHPERALSSFRYGANPLMTALSPTSGAVLLNLKLNLPELIFPKKTPSSRRSPSLAAW